MLINKLTAAAKITAIFTIWLIALLLIPFIAVLNGLCDWVIDEKDHDNP